MSSPLISQNIISTKSMEEIQDLLSKDPKAPKKIMVKGKYTKSFRKWNEKAIKDGKTLIYLAGDKVLKYYKNGKSRFINLKFDKRYKNKRVVSKSFKKINPTYEEDSSVLPVAKADFEKVFKPGVNYGDNYNNYSYWYKLLKPFEGNNIRIVIKAEVENPTEEITSELPDGEDLEYSLPKQEFINSLVQGFDGFKNMVFNRQISLPMVLSKKIFNNDNYYNTFIVSSRWRNILAYLTVSLKVKCKVFITKLVNLSPVELFQSFNEGGGCLLNPILDYFKDQYQTVESKSSKSKYQAAINILQGKQLQSGFKNGLLQTYKEGVPQDKITEVCDLLQIGIDIDFPFTRTNFISSRSHKKPRKVFKFINRTINHVEVSHIKHVDKQTIFLDRDELEKKLEDIENEGQNPFYTRDAYGTTAIHDINKLYKLDNPYRDCVNEWVKLNGVDGFYMDALKYPDLIKFVSMGCKWNGCRDFKKLNTINIDDCHHIDIKKAYTQFKQSQYYDGFVGKITDFRVVDNYKQKGCYLIKDLDLSNADPKFIAINNKLKWFENKNVYWDTELEALEIYGGKFKVVCGAFGTKTDFDFNIPITNTTELWVKGDELINNKIKCFAVNGKETKISYYAKMVGEWGSINYENKYLMKGDKRYFENLVDQGFQICFNDYDNEATIKFPKTNVKSLKHLAGQVTAYQRLLVLDQLIEMDIDKVVRVCVDGIYYLPHNFKGVEKIMCGDSDLWSCKNDDKTFNNGECASYVSGLMNNELELDMRYYDDLKRDPYKINMRKVLDELIGNNHRPYEFMGMKFGRKRDFYKTEFIGGQGGTGKSYNMLHDCGVIGGLYVSPSWKLATHQAKEIATGDYNHNFDTNVFHRIVNMDFEYKLTKKYNWLFMDECSMITECDKEKLIKMFGGKITFMGDLGYQLEPVLSEADKKKFDKSDETNYYKWIKDNKKYEMSLKGIENKIYYTKDRRAKDCLTLQKLKLKLRDFIKKGKKCKKDSKKTLRQEAINLVKETCQKGNIDEYNSKDLILASKHDFNKAYDEKFKDLEKYKIQNNTRDFKNGQIVFDKPEGVKHRLCHGFTIHEIQGETATNKLFIDLRKMFSDRMIYTAVSRARKISQIKLIY